LPKYGTSITIFRLDCAAAADPNWTNRNTRSRGRYERF
jgi:hypothetical protein